MDAFSFHYIICSAKLQVQWDKSFGSGAFSPALLSCAGIAEKRSALRKKREKTGKKA
jgi:hypothetical protein